MDELKLTFPILFVGRLYDTFYVVDSVHICYLQGSGEHAKHGIHWSVCVPW